MIVMSSCKKDDINRGLESPRIFKPSRISIERTETTAKITWEAPILSEGQDLTYTTEFSQDSTFATSEFSLDTDTMGVTVTDAMLSVRKKYYVRVKANAFGDQPESKWMVSSGFSINGEQLFLPVRDSEVKETGVTLRWKVNQDLTDITLIPTVGRLVKYPLSPAEVAAGVKTITDIIADTTYIAELFSGTRSRGFLTFRTPPVSVYNVVLNPGDDLAAAINAAENNAIIGLNPGVYNTANSGFTLLQKTITLKSTSSDPKDTKVNIKEFTLKGTGAGINLSGIEFDGKPANALYFFNLGGVSSDAELATYTQITVDNCIIHDIATSFMRTDRGAKGGDYKMDQIVIKNSLIYSVSDPNANYIFLHLNELEFKSLHVSKSTIHNFGRALITCSTVLTSMPPSITFDYCTLNSFGANNMNVLLSAGANPVKFNLTNSIIANVPRSATSTVNDLAISATSAESFTVFSNNNIFNFNNAAGAPLKFPTTNITQIGNQSINLGWTESTTDFTLPVGSVLHTVSNVGTAIGDPRWTY